MSDGCGKDPMPARGPDRFEEWLHAPVPSFCDDPRFEVRRALPSEFDAIYDLLDEAFGTKRQRSFCEWLYQRNPGGTARCWIVVEKRSGKVVATNAEWPWPVARGEQRLEGTQSGDVAVAPEWRRQGIDELRRQSKWLHPWFRRNVTLSWPNEKLHASDKKYDRGRRLMGPVPRQLLPLNNQRLLVESGWPRALAAVAGLAADATFAGRRLLRFGVRAGAEIEEIRRFDSTFDLLTKRCMFTKWFWCPHDAEFLNWRYLAHPTKDYRAFAILAGEAPGGYCVVGIDGERAWLMEFAALSSEIATTLLRHAIGVARNAECNRLEFFSTRGTPHRLLLDSTGFLNRPSQLFLIADGLKEPGIQCLENWQCGPGDTDFL